MVEIAWLFFEEIPVFRENDHFDDRIRLSNIIISCRGARGRQNETRLEAIGPLEGELRSN